MGGSLSISLLPRVTRFGQPMDTFRRLGPPTPISLNDGLSFNNDNNTLTEYSVLQVLGIRSRTHIFQLQVDALNTITKSVGLKLIALDDSWWQNPESIESSDARLPDYFVDSSTLKVKSGVYVLLKLAEMPGVARGNL